MASASPQEASVDPIDPDTGERLAFSTLEALQQAVDLVGITV
jgi:hypothetical protein